MLGLSSGTNKIKNSNLLMLWAQQQNYLKTDIYLYLYIYGYIKIMNLRTQFESIFDTQKCLKLNQLYSLKLGI